MLACVGRRNTIQQETDRSEVYVSQVDIFCARSDKGRARLAYIFFSEHRA